MSNFKEIKNICCHFTKNLAYHQAGIGEPDKELKNDFWRMANGNFAEIAILEFCKLFGGWNDQYRWQNVVEDENDFKKRIEVKTTLSFVEFENYVKEIKLYRDKYLSHHDQEIEFPRLQIATTAVFAYYQYIIERYGAGGFPLDLKSFYMNSFKEAEVNYPPNS